MSAYDELIAEFHEHFTRNGNACVMLGVEKHLDDLPDPSAEDTAARLDEARALLSRLRAFDRSNLDFDTSLDLDLATLKLEYEIHNDTYTFNGHTRLQQMPTAGDDIGDGLFNLFINDPRPAGERLRNIAARVRGIPAYCDALIGRLDTPVARWVKMDLEKAEKLPSLLTTLVGWAESEEWNGLAGLRTAQDEAERALASYRERLAALPTVTNIHLGEDTARKIVKLRGIDKSLDELREIATRFLSENVETIERLRGVLCKKYELDPAVTPVEKLHAFLNERYRLDTGGDLSRILVRYEAERDKILAFIKERDLFPVFDEQNMKILQTPGFMEPSIPAGAMMSPPPFRDGVRTSLVYLTLSEALMDEHTEVTIPSMMIHEGIPGHHLQLATASKHPSVVRRHIDAMDQAEGWTTMLEDYMLDQGYMGELADEARFCGKRDLARIGARVAIDLFFMTGERAYLDVGVDADIAADDPFDAAGNLLQTVTGFTAGRVQTELNWYSQERGYPLSYLTGNRLVWELKGALAAAQGADADPIEVDRTFHRVYLESGCMPVSFLRRVFDHKNLL